MRANIRIHGVRETKEYLQRARRRSKLFIRVLSPRMIEHLCGIIDGYFKNETGPEGPWLPLSQFTIARKGHDRILIETKRLRLSLIKRTPDSIVDVDNLHLGYGTRVPYAGAHVIGYEGGADVPKRNYIPPGDRYARDFARWSADYILGLSSRDIEKIEFK